MNNKGSEFNVSDLMSDKEKRNILRDRPKEPYGEYPRRIWVHPIDYDRSDLRNAWVVMQEEEGAVEFVKGSWSRAMSDALQSIFDHTRSDSSDEEKVTMISEALSSLLMENNP